MGDGIDSVVTVHPPETLYGAVRSIVCSGAAVAIAWHDPRVSGYALGVLVTVASPALARALLAPVLAFLLKR